MLRKFRSILSKTNRWHRVFTLLFIAEMGWLPGKQVGFRCNDPSLSHIYTGDTVSWKWLLAVASLLPLPIILITERLYHKNEVAPERSKQRALSWFKEFYYGFVVNLTFVEIVKKLYGSPRPHFFDTCQPKEALTCEGSDFVSSYTCTKGSWTIQSDGSFPSGHSSLALYSAVFIAYYLYHRTEYNVCRASVQLLCVTSGVLVGFSRMYDRRHHWWDVLGGATIGFIVCLYTVTLLCKNFNCINTKDDTSNELQIDSTYSSRAALSNGNSTAR